jgi:hypothetical protein
VNRAPGPDDRGPAPKAAKGANGGGAGGGGGGAPKAKGNNTAVEGDEPTWELGKNKKVKVGPV